MEQRECAILIQNMIQFYTLKNGIDELIKRKYLIDIYIPTKNDNSGFGDIFNSTYNRLCELGYSPKRTAIDNVCYKILMEPYPMNWEFNLKYTYRIKYKYSPITAKPDFAYTPDNNIFYDAILCYGNYEADYLSVYANTYVINNLKYVNFKRNENLGQKINLLYLPTYGNASYIDFAAEKLEKLKNEYYITIKAHHGTSYLTDEKYRIEKLKSVADEYYEQDKELIDLLAEAQVVLSDNSGSIFEAIYAGVPVAIFSEDINKNKYGKIDTVQYELVQNGDIPYTTDFSQIDTILKNAMSDEYVEKQNILRNKLFKVSDNPIEDFINIINKYLNDDINIKYKYLHDELVKDYQTKNKINFELKNTIEYQKKEYGEKEINLNNQIKVLEDRIRELEKINLELNEQNDGLKEKLNNLNININNLKTDINELSEQLTQKDKIIYYYESGKLYKLSKKVYNLYHKVVKNKE